MGLPRTRQPDCAARDLESRMSACVERANPERERRGLPLIHVYPQAYQPLEEG